MSVLLKRDQIERYVQSHTTEYDCILEQTVDAEYAIIQLTTKTAFTDIDSIITGIEDEISDEQNPCIVRDATEKKILIQVTFQNHIDKRAYEIALLVEDLGVEVTKYTIHEDEEIEVTPVLEDLVDSQKDFNALFSKVVFEVTESSYLDDNFHALATAIEERSQSVAHLYDDSFPDGNSFTVIISHIEIE